MGAMPTLYLRDVPESLYSRLRRRARRNRRSMNAEAVAILQQALDGDLTEGNLMKQLQALQLSVPEGAPSVTEILLDERERRRPRR